MYKYEQDLTPVVVAVDGVNARLLSGDMKLTNIRLFTEIVPDNEINKLLNQNIIRDDSRYLILADNANKRLVLPNYSIGQIGEGEV